MLATARPSCCCLWWPWVTFEVIHILRAFSNWIFHTVCRSWQDCNYCNSGVIAQLLVYQWHAVNVLVIFLCSSMQGTGIREQSEGMMHFCSGSPFMRTVVDCHCLLPVLTWFDFSSVHHLCWTSEHNKRASLSYIQKFKSASPRDFFLVQVKLTSQCGNSPARFTWKAELLKWRMALLVSGMLVEVT